MGVLIDSMKATILLVFVSLVAAGWQENLKVLLHFGNSGVQTTEWNAQTGASVAWTTPCGVTVNQLIYPIIPGYSGHIGQAQTDGSYKYCDVGSGETWNGYFETNDYLEGVKRNATKRAEGMPLYFQCPGFTKTDSVCGSIPVPFSSAEIPNFSPKYCAERKGNKCYSWKYKENALPNSEGAVVVTASALGFSEGFDSSFTNIINQEIEKAGDSQLFPEGPQVGAQVWKLGATGVNTGAAACASIYKAAGKTADSSLVDTKAIRAQCSMAKDLGTCLGQAVAHVVFSKTQTRQ